MSISYRALKKALTHRLKPLIPRRARRYISRSGIARFMGTSRRSGSMSGSQDKTPVDPAFKNRVAEGDGHRDAGDWAAAEQSYRAALRINPEQGGCWTQLGHMLKEQGRFAEAETAYRSACALGVRPHDVVEHLRFVLIRQGVEEWRAPIRFSSLDPSPAAKMPTRTDVELFGRLVWQAEAIAEPEITAFLRSHATCDSLLAAMVSDPRFEGANSDWLSVIRDGDL